MCQFSFLWILLEECLNLLLKQRGVVPGLVFLDFVKVYSTGNLVLAHKVDFLPWRRGWNPRPTLAARLESAPYQDDGRGRAL